MNALVLNLQAEREAITELAKGHNYSIVDSAKDELIGSCGLLAVDHLNGTAESGIFIGNREYWNKGYGAEAFSLLIDFGFRTLNLHNIMLRVYGFNQRARAMYEKVGFKQIGVRRQCLRRNLEVHDIIYMDILPEDFYRNRDRFQIA
jgi:RimJ/RimL family protein N-acetyltransferase